MAAERLNNASLGDRVYCYKNLTRGCWSLKALEGAAKGKVVAHLETLTLTDCVAKVSAAQARWVRENRKRLVCGGIVGTLASFEAPATVGARVTFRPLERDEMQIATTGETFLGAPVVAFNRAGCFLA